MLISYTSAQPLVNLTMHCPLQGVVRGCHVPLNQQNGLGSFLSAGNQIIRESRIDQPTFLIALPFWLEPISTFSSLELTTFI